MNQAFAHQQFEHQQFEHLPFTGEGEMEFERGARRQMPARARPARRAGPRALPRSQFAPPAPRGADRAWPSPAGLRPAGWRGFGPRPLGLWPVYGGAPYVVMPAEPAPAAFGPEPEPEPSADAGAADDAPADQPQDEFPTTRRGVPAAGWSADALTETRKPSRENGMHQKHCNCSACAGGFEIMAFAPRGAASQLSEDEALELVAELFEMENEEDLDLFLGKLVKGVGRAASDAAKAVGKAAKSIPIGKIADVAFKVVRGDVAGLLVPLLPKSLQNTVRAFSTDPFARFALQTTSAALRGENVLRAAQVAAKSGIADMRERMRFAAMVAPIIPGIGTGVAAALGAASALAAGQPITKAILAAARSAVPGGAIAQAAFDMGVNIARGKSLGEAALATARDQIPGGPAAKAAFDAAVALGQGKKIQDAAFAAAGGVMPKSPYAADALAFTRRVAAGENIGKAALSTAGKAVVKRLEREGVKVLGAASPRAARVIGAAPRKEFEFEFAMNQNEAGGFERMLPPPASGAWRQHGRQVVLYGV